MSITVSTTNPPVLGQSLGLNFLNIYPQVTATGTGDTLTLGASRVISVICSGKVVAGALTWSYTAPTLTITGLAADVYDIWVTYI